MGRCQVINCAVGIIWTRISAWTRIHGSCHLGLPRADRARIKGAQTCAVHAAHYPPTEPYVVLFFRMGFVPTKTAVGDMMGESGAGGGAN